jgi:hypothetical protein
MSVKTRKFTKTQKNPIKPKKTQKNPPGWVFLKKPGFLPTLVLGPHYGCLSYTGVICGIEDQLTKTGLEQLLITSSLKDWVFESQAFPNKGRLCSSRPTMTRSLGAKKICLVSFLTFEMDTGTTILRGTLVENVKKVKNQPTLLYTYISKLPGHVASWLIVLLHWLPL